MFRPNKLLNRNKSDSDTKQMRKAATPAEKAINHARAETAAKQDEAKQNRAAQSVAEPTQPTQPTPSKGVNQMKPGRAVEIPNTGYRNIPNMGRQDEGRTLTVGRDISLNGEISACDHLVVEGTVRAELKGGESLDILESGLFDGKVEINNADIAGRFQGELVVRGRLTVRATGVITGTVRYGELDVEAGAIIEGTLAAMSREKPVAVSQESFTHAVVEPKHAANEDAAADVSYNAEAAVGEELNQTLFAGAAE